MTVREELELARLEAPDLVAAFRAAHAEQLAAIPEEEEKKPFVQPEPKRGTTKRYSNGFRTDSETLLVVPDGEFTGREMVAITKRANVMYIIRRLESYGLVEVIGLRRPAKGSSGAANVYVLTELGRIERDRLRSL